MNCVVYARMLQCVTPNLILLYLYCVYNKHVQSYMLISFRKVYTWLCVKKDESYNKRQVMLSFELMLFE